MGNSRRIVTVTIPSLLIACAVATAGCKGDSSKPGGGKDAADPLNYVPATSNLLVGVDVPKVSASPLVRQVLIPTLQGSDTSRADAIQSACLDGMKSITLGGETGDHGAMVFVANGLQESQLPACAAALADVGADEVTVTREGRVSKVSARGQRSWVGWGAGGAAVSVNGADDAAAVELVLSAADKRSDNSDLKALIGDTKTDANIWFSFRNPSGAAAVEGVPYKMLSAHGTIDLSSGFVLDMVARAENPEEATRMVETVRNQLKSSAAMPPFKVLYDGHRIGAKGDLVEFRLVLSQAQVETLVPILTTMAPMMMGGARGGL